MLLSSFLPSFQSIYKLKKVCQTEEEPETPQLSPEEVVDRIFQLVDENGDGKTFTVCTVLVVRFETGLLGKSVCNGPAETHKEGTPYSFEDCAKSSKPDHWSSIPKNVYVNGQCWLFTLAADCCLRTCYQKSFARSCQQLNPKPFACRACVLTLSFGSAQMVAIMIIS